MLKRPPSIILILGVVAAVVFFVALNKLVAPPSSNNDSDQAQPAATSTPANTPSTKSASNKHGGKKLEAVIDTVKGTIIVRLFTDEMPISTKNFIDLANRKFYDGLTFHRVEDWVIQGGDPQGTGMGGSGKTIPLEINKKYKFDQPGMAGMARSADPNSASSQFFITKTAADWLSDQYALFGQVTSGMNVVNTIKKGDKIKSITIKPWEKPKATSVEPGTLPGPEGSEPPPPPPAPKHKK